MKPISRFAFLGTFLATITAWAQEHWSKIGTKETIITPCRPKLQWSGQIPLCNGQCPNSECSYRAPEFHLPIPPGGASEILKHGELHYQSSPSNLVRLNRCPNCNTAFWQDPEPTK